MILIRILISLVFFLGSVALVRACETPQVTIRVWQKLMPGARIAYVTGRRAEMIVTAFKGPLAAGDEVVIAYPVRGLKAAVAMYKAGCATDRGPIDRRQLKRILNFKDAVGRGV